MCHQSKPLSEFGTPKHRKHNSYCYACCNIRAKKRYSDAPEKQVFSSLLMRSKKLGIESPDYEDFLVIYYGNTCYYCGLNKTNELTNGNKGSGKIKFSIDHKTPFARGGNNDTENICLCCEPCNRAKHDMNETEYRAWLKGVAIRLVFGN